MIAEESVAALERHHVSSPALSAQASVPAPRLGQVPAQRQSRSGRARASRRGRASCASTVSPAQSSGWGSQVSTGPAAEPVRRRVARPGQRHAAAVAAGVDAAGPRVHRVLDPVARAVLDLGQARAPRPGRGRTRRGAPWPAAPPPGPGGGRGRRSVGVPKRFAVEGERRVGRGRSGSPAGSRRGWRAPRWPGRRPARARRGCASIDVAQRGRRPTGAAMKSKLNAVCSSSGRR